MRRGPGHFPRVPASLRSTPYDSPNGCPSSAEYHSRWLAVVCQAAEYCSHGCPHIKCDTHVCCRASRDGNNEDSQSLPAHTSIQHMYMPRWVKQMAGGEPHGHFGHPVQRKRPQPARTRPHAICFAFFAVRNTGIVVLTDVFSSSKLPRCVPLGGLAGYPPLFSNGVVAPGLCMFPHPCLSSHASPWMAAAGPRKMDYCAASGGAAVSPASSAAAAATAARRCRRPTAAGWRGTAGSGPSATRRRRPGRRSCRASPASPCCR